MRAGARGLQPGGQGRANADAACGSVLTCVAEGRGRSTSARTAPAAISAAKTQSGFAPVSRSPTRCRKSARACLMRRRRRPGSLLSGRGEPGGARRRSEPACRGLGAARGCHRRPRCVAARRRQERSSRSSTRLPTLWPHSHRSSPSVRAKGQEQDGDEQGYPVTLPCLSTVSSRVRTRVWKTLRRGSRGRPAPVDVR
jgi:hypothetical protein